MPAQKSPCGDFTKVTHTHAYTTHTHSLSPLSAGAHTQLTLHKANSSFILFPQIGAMDSLAIDSIKTFFHSALHYKNFLRQ
jgi:hypothetical protein